MARDTSKRNGGRNGKASGAGNRKRATRPPIIDASATEIPVTETSKPTSQADSRAETKAPARNFAELSANLWNDVSNWLGGLSNIVLWPQKYLWLAGVSGLVIFAGLYALLSKPAPVPDTGPNFQTLMQQGQAENQRQIADLQRQLKAMDAGLRADIAKDNLQRDAQIKAQLAQSAKMATSLEALVARLSTMERALQASNTQAEQQFKVQAAGLEEIRKLAMAAQASAKNAEAIFKVVQERFAKLEAAPRQVPVSVPSVPKLPSIAQITKFKTAGAALIGALGTQKGFADRLSAYAKIAPDDPAVALLRPYAETGAPNIAQLLAQAQAFAKPVDVAASQNEKPAQTGLYDKIATWSKTIVRVRRKSDKPIQSRIRTQAWGRIALQLEKGRLGEGLALALTLPGRLEHDVWVKQAEARLLIDRQIKSLQAKLDAVQSIDTQPRKGG